MLINWGLMMTGEKIIMGLGRHGKGTYIVGCEITEPRKINDIALIISADITFLCVPSL